MQSIIILVVEDSPLAMTYIKHLFKQIGYKADFVNNAEEALLLHYENQYDLIFNDIKLPKMDGLSMALKIRKFERTHCLKSTNIVTITSYNLNNIKHEIQSMGVNAAMNKPINAALMFDCISRCENAMSKS